ncbi:copper amine oxidase N-terminal domain-containing protein [Paenibacillus sp. UNC451MF]|uniref:copper amine oxidase N-terminal domain-containing protein n=1 Tax=Paenibacillus sp. UNC451MF TaxID=1449063 RepID=UPI0018CC65E9
MDTSILLTVGQEIAYKNNAPIALSAQGQIINGSTLVPLRFVGEALGVLVGWDGITQTVSLSSCFSIQYREAFS